MSTLPIIEGVAINVFTLKDVVAGVAATQLTTLSTPTSTVAIRSLAANTSTIRVGDKNITSTQGVQLSAGDTAVFAVNDVSLLWIIGNGTDSVSITYVS